MIYEVEKKLIKAAFNLLHSDTNGDYEIISDLGGNEYSIRINNHIKKINLSYYLRHYAEEVERKEYLFSAGSPIIKSNENIFVTKYNIYFKNQGSICTLYKADFTKLYSNSVVINFDTNYYTIDNIIPINKMEIKYPNRFFINGIELNYTLLKKYSSIFEPKYFDLDKKVYLDKYFQIQKEITSNSYDEFLLYYKNKKVIVPGKKINFKEGCLYLDFVNNELYLCLPNTNYVYLKTKIIEAYKSDYREPRLIYEVSTKKYFLINTIGVYDLTEGKYLFLINWFEDEEIEEYLLLNKNPTLFKKQLKLTELLTGGN